MCRDSIPFKVILECTHIHGFLKLLVYLVSLKGISFFTTFLILSAKVQTTPNLCGCHTHLSKLSNWFSASAYSIATREPWKFCSDHTVHQENVPFF